jgi:hypothetical protein
MSDRPNIRRIELEPADDEDEVYEPEYSPVAFYAAVFVVVFLGTLAVLFLFQDFFLGLIGW